MKELGTKTLETERLILRKYKLEDAKDMYKNWGTDPNCNIYLPWKLHENIDETKEIITNWINSYDKDKFKWIIELKKETIAIGGIDVVNLNKQARTCEIAYCISSKFWNNGYATEAVNRVIDYLFNECDMYLIEADHQVSNIASGIVLQKCNMTKECVLRKRRVNKKTNQLEDIAVYSITREEYNKQKNSYKKV